MASSSKNLLCWATVFVASGLLAFSLISEDTSGKSQKLSNRQMAGVRGMLDCEDDTGLCKSKDDSYVPWASLCESIESVTVDPPPSLPTDPTPAQLKEYQEKLEDYQNNLASKLPKCRKRTDNIKFESPDFETKKGEDTEVDKKYKCAQSIWCQDNGVAVSKKEKTTTQVPDPSPPFYKTVEICADSTDPLSYCLACSPWNWEWDPDDKQPDILKCKDDDE